MSVRRFPIFLPRLAGATLRERLVGCLGALVGVGLAALICRLCFGPGSHLALLVAPMGATAVLLFAVPASPLAQPWPIVGGNTLSALVGVAVAHAVGDPALAAALAVALAIAAMSLARCLHPPGGAAALTAVLGGPAVAASGWLFPIAPVALNSLILVTLGIAVHGLTRRAYPHVPAQVPPVARDTADRPPQLRAGFQPQDVDAALAGLNETFDIERGDLDLLLRRVEQQALERSHGDLLCRDIMSRDVVSIGAGERADHARALMLDHNIRTLPVLDGEGGLLGTVGLRELAQAGDLVADHVARTATAAPGVPATTLVPVLTDGRHHAVVVVDGDRRVQGIITQTDLLAALARLLPLVDKVN